MPTFADRLLALLPDLYAMSDETGDLNILLQVVGPTCDELYAAINALPALIGVDSCLVEFLPSLAVLVGMTIDLLADPLDQRRVIREAVVHYQRHGTLTALRHALKGAGWQGEIIETRPRVLRLNTQSALCRQTLPGRHYNRGVYVVTNVQADDGEYLAIITDHEPAGTLRWIEE